jgi:putative glutamine amidotransferase
VTTVALLAGREPAHRYSMHRGYADCIWQAGATPIVLVPPPDPGGIERYVEAAMDCDAVCVTGGGDVDPRRYGQEPIDGLKDVDITRDVAEEAVVCAAYDIRRPVLGICRGIQVLAVALGGTLHQDLPSGGYPGHWEDERQHEPVHPIRALDGSHAADALAGALEVNSIHHQAVRTTGAILRASAWAADGVIEAVETDTVLGIQWHPERLAATDPRHLAPFRWLLDVAVPA